MGLIIIKMTYQLFTNPSPAAFTMPTKEFVLESIIDFNDHATDVIKYEIDCLSLPEPIMHQPQSKFLLVVFQLPVSQASIMCLSFYILATYHVCM